MKRKRRVRHVRVRSHMRVLKPSRHQTGSTHRHADMKRRAARPGKRRSRTGNVYYEYRRNRSDINPRNFF